MKQYKPPSQVWSKAIKDLYGRNFCFTEKKNWIYGGKNHKYMIEWFNLDNFPMIINLN